MTARVDLRATIDDAARRDTMRQALLQRIRQAPGVRSATFSQLGLFTGAFSTRHVEVEGYTQPTGPGEKAPETTVDAVGPDYFATLGIAGFAAYLPARRASKLEPVAALRAD